MRVFYERKTRELEGKLRTFMHDNRNMLSKNKQHDIHEMMEDIKSFKSMLPNSVKTIPIMNSDQSIEDRTAPPLLN